MGISVKDLRRLLEKVLQCERDETGKHIRYRFKVNGRTVGQTHYSHSWGDSEQIDNIMLNLQAKEMKCSSSALWKKLLSGQASKEDYFTDLLKNGHISQEEFDILCRRGNASTKG